MNSEGDDYKPKYHEDRRPRYGKTKTGAVMFWHPCKVCGLVSAPFGVNVSIAKGRFGDWYCAEHLPEEHQPPAMRRRHATPQKSPE